MPCYDAALAEIPLRDRGVADQHQGAAVAAQDALSVLLGGQGERVPLILRQRPKQHRPGLRRVAEVPCCNAQPHGRSRVGGPQSLGHRRGTAGCRLDPLMIALRVLLPGDHAHHECDHSEHGQRHEEGALPSRGAGGSPAFLGTRGRARGEEISLHYREVVTLRGGEGLFGRRQSHSPVQRAGIAVQRLPRFSGLSELAVNAQAFTIGVNPTTQPGPASYERLMSEVDSALIEGE